MWIDCPICSMRYRDPEASVPSRDDAANQPETLRGLQADLGADDQDVQDRDRWQFE